jgi:hypothetical protein
LFFALRLRGYPLTKTKLGKSGKKKKKKVLTECTVCDRIVRSVVTAWWFSEKEA